MFLTINDIKDVAGHLEAASGIEFSGYALSFFRRRITDVFDKFAVKNLKEFYVLLEDKQKLEETLQMLSVGTTELFRDPGFWRALRKWLKGQSKPKIWIPMATDGFELYSLLVILKMAEVIDAEITVNVLSDTAMEEVKSFKVSSKLDDVNVSNFERLESNQQFTTYFNVDNEGFDLLRNVDTRNVKVRKAWFMQNAGEKYDVILFRNVLWQYNFKLNQKAVDFLQDAMVDGGVLAIGTKENLLNPLKLFKAVDEVERIYTLK